MDEPEQIIESVVDSALKRKSLKEWRCSREDLDKIKSYALLGLNKTQVANALGITLDTLGNWGRKDIRVANAYDQGQALGVARVAQALHRNINEGSVEAQKFFLARRGGWTEKTTVEIEANQDAVDTMRALTDALKVAAQAKQRGLEPPTINGR